MTAGFFAGFVVGGHLAAVDGSGGATEDNRSWYPHVHVTGFPNSVFLLITAGHLSMRRISLAHLEFLAGVWPCPNLNLPDAYFINLAFYSASDFTCLGILLNPFYKTRK